MEIIDYKDLFSKTIRNWTQIVLNSESTLSVALDPHQVWKESQGDLFFKKNSSQIAIVSWTFTFHILRFTYYFEIIVI